MEEQHMEVYKFQDQLKVGKMGETRLVDHFTDIKLSHTCGRRGDLEPLDGACVIELKTDSYKRRDGSASTNFFIETWSVLEENRLGGPWQASEYGCKWLIYFFSLDSLIYVFDVEELLSFIRLNYQKWAKKIVTNPGYHTEGLLVPRKELAECAALILELTEENKGTELMPLLENRKAA
jgi:hypothetical protein